MELKAIRLFVALADELHFGKAAKRAGVAQSVLSLQIKRLEDRLGAPLFTRSTREVRLTDVGVVFREEAEGVLRRTDQALRAADAAVRGRGRLLRIGATSAVELSNIMSCIATFRAQRPEVQVLIRELGTVDQEAALVSGDINIGLLHPPLDQTDLSVVDLSIDPFYAVGHPSFYRFPEELDWTWLLSQPLVFYSRRRALRLFDQFIGFAQARGVTANIVAEAESFFAAIAMAQAGLGIAFIPRQMLQLQRNLAVAPLPEGMPLFLETACAFHASATHDTLVQDMVTHFVEHSHSGPPA